MHITALDLLFLSHITGNRRPCRLRVRLRLTDRILCVRISALSIRACNARFFALYDTRIVIDLVTLRVDESCARFVSGGEGDLALELLDLGFVEEVTILVAILDLLFCEGTVGWDVLQRLLLARCDVDVLLRVVGDRRCWTIESGWRSGRWTGGSGYGKRIVGVLGLMLAVYMMGVTDHATYIVEEVVAVPVPGLEQLDTLALLLCPLVAVRQRRVQAKCRHA